MDSEQESYEFEAPELIAALDRHSSILQEFLSTLQRGIVLGVAPMSAGKPIINITDTKPDIVSSPADPSFPDVQGVVDKKYNKHNQDDVRLSMVTNHQKNEGRIPFAFTLSVGSEVAKRLGWNPRNVRVYLEVSEQGLKVTPTTVMGEGYKLCYNGSPTKSRLTVRCAMKTDVVGMLFEGWNGEYRAPSRSVPFNVQVSTQPGTLIVPPFPV